MSKSVPRRPRPSEPYMCQIDHSHDVSTLYLDYYSYIDGIRTLTLGRDYTMLMTMNTISSKHFTWKLLLYV